MSGLMCGQCSLAPSGADTRRGWERARRSALIGRRRIRAERRDLATFLNGGFVFVATLYRNMRQVVAATHGVNMHTNTRDSSSFPRCFSSSPTLTLALPLPQPLPLPSNSSSPRPRPTVCPRLVERRRGRGELATQPAFERLPSGLAGGGRVRRGGELDAGLAGATRALARAGV